jgi:replicative DNA helicase
MSPIQYLKRLMAAYSGVEGKKLRTGQGITTDEWERLGDACSELAGWNMPFTFSVRTIEELAAEARRRKDTKGLDLLIVDYMQLLKVQRPVESDFVRVSTVSHEIKRLALDLDIPILALAQVTRPESKGKLTMPTLDTLRGSGDIEQDADNVLFLHRPENPADDSINPKHASVAEACMRGNQNQYVVLNIAKQRNGTNRMIDMIFDPAHMVYRCWAD